MKDDKQPDITSLPPDASPSHQSEQERLALAQSDIGMVRILEDLIDLLIARDHIRFTDLPEHAQTKLLTRKSLRLAMHQRLDLLADDDDDIGLI